MDILRLSNVLSEATEQALRDLELVRNDPDYVINFNKWHEKCEDTSQFEKRKCAVCFAGSVMVKSLGANINTFYVPQDFPEESSMLLALDFIRKGNILNALLNLKMNMPKNCESTMSVDQDNYENFVRDIKLIIEYLKNFKL